MYKMLSRRATSDDDDNNDKNDDNDKRVPDDDAVSLPCIFTCIFLTGGSLDSRFARVHNFVSLQAYLGEMSLYIDRMCWNLDV